ncbi:MAG: MarR family transcriptional regulator [Oscillospiraceae bacterium]|nr:MarR family transcriptional regulator [Oscillospiraceae bacterium]MBR5722707.1 MarR family transcriptional regulator [Oscillospiraceae bacterium]
MECDTMLALRMLNVSIRRRIDSSQIKQELDHLTGPNSWVLGYLADHEGEDIYQRDLEKDLCICRSAVSKMVADLEKNGLVERGRVAGDDRLKRLVLTERGREYTERIRADNRQLEQQLVSGFSEAELAALHGYLKRMQDNLT